MKRNLSLFACILVSLLQVASFYHVKFASPLQISSKFGRQGLEPATYTRPSFQLSTVSITASPNYVLSSSYQLFINRKSGGQMGRYLLQQLRRILNPSSICDLLYEKPLAKLNETSTVHMLGRSAICCGGDGTIRWIMDEAHTLNLSQHINFGILPLGTGNDLFNHILMTYMKDRREASALNYRLSSSNLLFQTSSALQCFAPPQHITPFDRWKISFKRPGSSSSSSSNSSQVNFNNYFGLGIDGDITCLYDNLRRQRPYLFFHRFVNKIWFGLVWIYKFCRGNTKDLSKVVELYVDGRAVDIKHLKLKGIILPNIASYAGGTRLWSFTDSQWQNQAADDGLIEVVGLTSLTHLAQVKGGLAKPIPLAQGRHIRLVTKVRLPMQVDGEPLIEKAAEIEVQMLESVKLIVPKPGEL